MAQEAWRHLADFDDIISGAPALDHPGLVATQFAWLMQANTGVDFKETFARRKFRLVTDALLAACDATDGPYDGLIDDPRACEFKPGARRRTRAASARFGAALAAVAERQPGQPEPGADRAVRRRLPALHGRR
jgi:hypothetical protein